MWHPWVRRPTMWDGGRTTEKTWLDIPATHYTLTRYALNDTAYQPFLVPQCVPLHFDSFRVGRAVLLSFVGRVVEEEKVGDRHIEE